MKQLIIVVAILATAGCSSVDITSYRENEPKFDLVSYFEGSTQGWGIVQDRKGELLRHFSVDITGEKTEQGHLILHEEFVWNDGEHTSRTWTISPQNLHSFTGSADDVVGDAVGVSYGNVLNWKYKLNLKIDDSTWEIAFDDWMFQVSGELLINRATMSKFGFTVGEVTIVFRKQNNRGQMQ